MSTRRETNHKYSSGVILSRNTYRKIDSNACEKRGRVHFRLERQDGRRRKNRLALIGLKN